MDATVLLLLVVVFVMLIMFVFIVLVGFVIMNNMVNSMRAHRL